MYLTLIPEYTGSCIHDDSGNQIEIQDLKLPKSLLDELTLWQAAYREIIPLSDEERLIITDRIEQLDNIGLSLAQKLQDLVPGGVRVN